MSSDGTYVSSRLTERRFSSWLPDGSGLMVYSKEGVFIISKDGLKTDQISDINVRSITWSPAKDKILINTSSYNEEGDLYAMNPDGADIIKINKDKGYYHSSEWSPDGKYIIFTEVGEKDTIYIVGVDGSGFRRLSARDTHAGIATFNPALSLSPITFPPTPTPVSTSTDEILVFYPLEVGLERVYKVKLTGLVDFDESTNLPIYEDWTITVTERITDSYQEGDDLIFKVIFENYPDYIGVDGPVTEDWETEYRISGNSLFLNRSELLQWPLIPGRAWPFEEGLTSGSSCWYMWDLTNAEDVSVPAGNFKDCVTVQLWTRPDHSIDTYCPGAGWTERMYVHHGGPDDIREWELISIRKP